MTEKSQSREQLDSNFCPRCGRMLKQWSELSPDAKTAFLQIGKITVENAKKHRFCERCLFIETQRLYRA